MRVEFTSWTFLAPPGGMFLGLIPRDRWNYAAIKMEKCPSRTFATIFFVGCFPTLMLRAMFRCCVAGGDEMWKCNLVSHDGKCCTGKLLSSFPASMNEGKNLVRLVLPAKKVQRGRHSPHFAFVYSTTIFPFAASRISRFSCSQSRNTSSSVERKNNFHESLKWKFKGTRRSVGVFVTLHGCYVILFLSLLCFCR